MKKFFEYIFYALIVLLPFQTRWMYRLGELNGGYWEYGSLSMYGIEIFVWILLLVSGFELLKSRKAGFSRPKNFFHILIFIFVLGILLTHFVTNVGALNRAVSFQHFFWMLESAAIFFFILNFPISFKRAAWSFSIAGVIQSAIALWQFSSQRVIASKYLGMAAHSASDILGESVIENSWGRFLRAYGTLPHPNILAGFLVFCALFSMYLFLKSQKTREGIAALFFFLFILLGLTLTFSRAGYMAFVISAFWYLILDFTQSKNWNKILVLSAAFLSVTLSFSIIYMELASTRVQTQPRLERISLETRQKLFSESIKVISRRWVSGVGGGNYTVAVWQEVDRNKKPWEYQPVHLVYLVILAELGLAGLIFFSGLLFLALFHSLRNRTYFQGTIVFALSFLGFFDHYLWSLFFGIFLFWLILALGLKHEKALTTP